jgi:hypothetical protein
MSRGVGETWERDITFGSLLLGSDSYTVIIGME